MLPRTSTHRSGITPVGQYPRGTMVQAVARALDCRERTAAQALKESDPRNLWLRAATATAGLCDAGYVLEARARCRPIFAALEPQPLFVTKDAVIGALLIEQDADGLEDVAQVALIEFTPAALDTYLKRAEKHHAAQGHAIALIRAYLGKPC